MTVVPLSIPSPSESVWWIGPVPIRAYGLLIMCGMLIAVWWSSKRYAKRGGNPDVLFDVALWAIPFGIVGARIYHVITSPDNYFGPNGEWVRVFYIWEGGIGIWGGVIGGALGVWLALKRSGARLAPVADAIAPALLVAQAIGRWGNWFNQELFGAPTTLPWGLEIDAAHLPAGYAEGTLFHPTFLYESLWNLAAAFVIVRLEKKMRLYAGQVFAMYLLAYPLGRMWIEYVRIDEAYSFLGLRLNIWTSLAMFILGIALYVLAGKRADSPTVDAAEPGAIGKDEDAVGSDSVADPSLTHERGDEAVADNASVISGEAEVTSGEADKPDAGSASAIVADTCGTAPLEVTSDEATRKSE
ncbi:prolipoprotein diacylglyceryl transferase [Schaalia suimastitidis]|uniref:prolipoprotein diacylglyceryl transferase n=1 Tax=Schaalia suimastitidis TaxID=121163 RepID=UPI000422B685|nr:prolipoprotein diacylglyceryl transferase [Schaalia suimastitidis]